MEQAGVDLLGHKPIADWAALSSEDLASMHRAAGLLANLAEVPPEGRRQFASLQSWVEAASELKHDGGLQLPAYLPSVQPAAAATSSSS